MTISSTPPTRNRMRTALAFAILAGAVFAVVHQFQKTQPVTLAVELPLTSVEVHHIYQNTPLVLAKKNLREISLAFTQSGETKVDITFPFSNPSKIPPTVNSSLTLGRGHYTVQALLTFVLPDGSLLLHREEKSVEIEEEGLLTLEF